MSDVLSPNDRSRSLAVTLSPLGAAVFVGFLVVGVAIPVLPLHVRNGLGMSTFVVGLVSGAQFAASLLSRLWSGSIADRLGPKRALAAGLLAAIVSGLIYVASTALDAHPALSVAVLLVGRAVLGGAESFIITGALSWALALAGPQHAGRVMAWIGTAMYVAFAVGAPLGTALYAWHGFLTIALATAIVPAVTWTAVLRVPAEATATHTRNAPSGLAVLRAVWIPGLGLAFSSVGFGTLTTFVALLVIERGWGAPWLAFSTFSLAFVIARIALGQLPDRLGGARVALCSVLVEAMGQALIWRAGSLPTAVLGAGITGLGYALVYPGLGVEAVRRAPPQAKALAMGMYTAFLDLTLGLTSPLLGLLAAGAGTGSVFLAATLSVTCSAAVALTLLRTARRRSAAPA